MSNTNKVPSAEKVLKKYGITASTSHHNYQYLYRSILEAMHESNRLHLEAMRDELTSGDEKVVLVRDIEKAINNYIKNNKL